MVGIEQRAKVLLILSSDTLDRARAVAGRATTSLKLPVSLQVVLRALIEEGLKRSHRQALLANVAAQARAVHAKRSRARWKSAASGPTALRSEASPTKAGARRSPRHR